MTSDIDFGRGGPFGLGSDDVPPYVPDESADSVDERERIDTAFRRFLHSYEDWVPGCAAIAMAALEAGFLAGRDWARQSEVK